MADGKVKHDCGLAAAQMALLANCNRDPKKRPKPYTAEDFFSLNKKPDTIIKDTRLTLDMMRKAFCPGKKKGK
jgi:hypothetical protein